MYKQSASSQTGGRGVRMFLPVISGGSFAMRMRRVPIPAISIRTEECSPGAFLYTVLFVACIMYEMSVNFI